MRAGVAVLDVTPPPGLAMAGFGVRTEPAVGTHDPLTVRALVVDDTALVTADVLGLHEAMSARIRACCGLDPDAVVLAATHTHGGPVSMAGRAGTGHDDTWLARLEEACVEAVRRAAAAREPVRLTVALGEEPGVARNRRRPDGPVDAGVPVLRFRRPDGSVLAIVAGYACHPVVVGAHNRLWTADYPGSVRDALEAAEPGAVALFVTGACGDVNTGHGAGASLTLGVDPARTFEAARACAARIAAAALAAPERPAGTAAAGAATERHLAFARRETEPPAELAARWRAERAGADPVRALLLDHWIGWAERVAPLAPVPWRARVTLLDWGGVLILGLPGEIFAASGLDLRARLAGRDLLLAGYAEGNPGYIPPAAEFAHGGYEIDEAHRYYGLPATFAPGAAETLVEAARRLAERPGGPSRA